LKLLAAFLAIARLEQVGRTSHSERKGIK